jgi:hypothetical protein
MMRLVIFALPAYLLSCVTPPDTPTATELCTIDDAGAVSGVDPWPCQHMIDRYATLRTGAPVPGTFLAGEGPIIAMGRGPGHRWSVEFNRDARWDATTPERYRQFRAGTGLHEVGHLWLHPEFDGVAHADTFAVKYGTPAPDWLDEAWAVWVEGSAQRTQRLEQLRLSAMPSLPALVTMRHPIRAQDDLERVIAAMKLMLTD